MSNATTNAKELLLHNLRMQESYLRKNAEMVREIYGDVEQAHELEQGAKKTITHIEKIYQEINP